MSTIITIALSLPLVCVLFLEFKFVFGIQAIDFAIQFNSIESREYLEKSLQKFVHFEKKTLIHSHTSTNKHTLAHAHTLAENRKRNTNTTNYYLIEIES